MLGCITGFLKKCNIIEFWENALVGFSTGMVIYTEELIVRKKAGGMLVCITGFLKKCNSIEFRRKKNTQKQGLTLTFLPTFRTQSFSCLKVFTYKTSWWSFFFLEIEMLPYTLTPTLFKVRLISFNWHNLQLAEGGQYLVEYFHLSFML